MENQTKVYVAKKNTDQTEGRGIMIPFGYFLNDPDAALKAVKGQGVMGVGDGEVDVITFNGNRPGVTEKFYGYHRNYRGKWVHGLMNDVKPPQSEEEDYNTYLNLRQRFEGR